ncbi:MAG: hypothetical protein NC231_05240 [Bacillus sp. (in: Bacteria)]|nr:hypothetical protein [Bacillus sp. (in: firmicutes)]MCM1426988.1 hypothetical protein [Eubacterium sp.]
MCFKEDSFDYQILNLTNKFYSDYPDPPYKEIVRKNSRPYNCLLVQSHYGYFICIPYRSHISHKYAFKFKNSIRSKKTSSGLDYSKIVIITNKEYIGSTDAIIDKDEFNETRNNIEYIKNDAQQYIDNYVNYLMGRAVKYDKREFERIYGYSTLQYFHNELEITISNINKSEMIPTK